jgi:hypothetical protein
MRKKDKREPENGTQKSSVEMWLDLGCSWGMERENLSALLLRCEESREGWRGGEKSCALESERKKRAGEETAGVKWGRNEPTTIFPQAFIHACLCYGEVLNYSHYYFIFYLLFILLLFFPLPFISWRISRCP